MMNGAGWGDNVSGQLAGGFRGAVRHVPVECAAFGSVDAIMAAYGTSYALKNGELWACGENVYGQFGDGTRTTARVNPAKVPLNQEPLQFSPAGAHWLALLDDQTLATCGGNSFGTLGNGTTGEGHEKEGSTIPVYLPEPTNVDAVVAGGGNCAALVNDQVWIWGEGKRGETGDGTKEEKTRPTLVPGLTTVKSLSLGGAGSLGTHALALLDDGTVMAWGSNNHGQLGDGTTENRLSPTPVPGLSGVVAVSAGASHSLFLMSDGIVFGCGSNAAGQLGIEPVAPAITKPQVIPLPGPVATISAGFRYSTVLIAGRVYVFGTNDHGTLAEFPGEYSTKPILVPLPSVSTLWASDFEVVVGLTAHASPPPVTCTPVSGGLRIAWQPGMAKKLGVREVAPGHQTWEGIVDVSKETAHTVSVPTGVAYEVVLTGGPLGYLVVEGKAL